MKSKLLATLSMTLFSFPAFGETVIAASCECSFNVGSEGQTILVYAERTEATEFDLENCSLIDGKMATGTCWSAKGEAQFQCLKEARAIVGYGVDLSSLALNEDACYGQISTR